MKKNSPPSLSGYLDSNQGPPAPKAGTLANCATPRINILKEQTFSAEREGFEPSIQV